MSRHSLIPASAEKLMREQDEAREKARRTGKGVFNTHAFARSIEADLKLALEGKSADVVETAEGPIVVKRLSEKYVVRSRWLKLCLWQSRTFRNGFGPLFKLNRKPFRFLFNEGGRVLTLSIIEKTLPFRLYVGGWVLMYQSGRWSFRHR